MRIALFAIFASISMIWIAPAANAWRANANASCSGCKLAVGNQANIDEAAAAYANNDFSNISPQLMSTLENLRKEIAQQKGDTLASQLTVEQLAVIFLQDNQ